MPLVWRKRLRCSYSSSLLIGFIVSRVNRLENLTPARSRQLQTRTKIVKRWPKHRAPSIKLQTPSSRETPNTKLQASSCRETPNSKLQAPSSRETPNSKLQTPSSRETPKFQ